MQQEDASHFQPLATERLILRMPEISDAGEIARLRSDASVNQYLDRPKSVTVDEAVEFINKIIEGIKNKGWLYWVICPGGNKPAGVICLWNIDRENARAEVGYELHPDFQGKGLMQEAMSKIIEYGFNTLQLGTIVAGPKAANAPSIKLLEKNNFTRGAMPANEEASDDYLFYSLKRVQ